MSRLNCTISKYNEYTRPRTGLFEVFADDEDVMITYRAQRNGDIYVMITDYNGNDPKPALDVTVDNLRSKEHNCKIMLKKGIDA